MIDHGGVIAARRIVPHGHDGAMKLPGLKIEILFILHQIHVIKNQAPEILTDEGQLRSDVIAITENRARVKLALGIEAECQQIAVEGVLFHSDHIGIAKSLALTNLPPVGQDFGRIRDKGRPIHDQQRSAVHADVALVLHVRFDAFDESLVTLHRLVLVHDDLAAGPVKAAGPRIVGPAQAEGLIDLRIV